MSDVLIIGNGPAGISAALYTARAGLSTVVIGKDSGALAKADKIENYYGFDSPVNGSQLLENGIVQAKRVGASIINDEVVSISYTGKLVVKTRQKEYSGDSVIIATGSSRSAPKIKDMDKFEGKGISYCAVCDGFFYRGKDVAVIGSGEYALNEAKELSEVANSVTILTNGNDIIAPQPDNLKVIKKKIVAFEGEAVLEKVVFADGESISVAGVFIAVGVAGSSDLAKKIGAETDGKRILVTENMATNVPGLFAAGDCTGGMMQVVKAVYEGARAGTEAVKYLRQLKANMK
jgi:thioredoxin reductase (NADPH)